MIAIVGAHQRTRPQAPFNDARWQIWSLSPRNMGKLPRYDLWFEMHRDETLELPENEGYVNWLRDQPAVYMTERRGNIPGSIEYPRQAILNQFGPYFFTSSISWMLALAISERPEAIGIFGVETSQPDEYRDERPGHHHFIQVARDRGIEIVTAPNSSILELPRLYGYDY